jgi:hemerythrin-like domain-containing protein
MTATLKILREEHAVLASMLRTLPLLVSAGDGDRGPDFKLLRDMVFYVADFPERQHHRKESDLLFPKLRARAPWARELLDRLEDEHARGESWIHTLEHALTAWELIGEPRRAAFEVAVRRYTEFYLAHMALEESDILPLALQVLTPADWDELDQALVPEPDPLTGLQPEAAYRALFDRIVFTVPERVLATVALPQLLSDALRSRT